MADNKKQEKPKKTDNTKQGKPKNSEGGGPGILSGLLAILVSLVIIFLVGYGVFYYVVSRNIQGIGERYRPQIQSWPILNYALPIAPDPNDQKYLDDSEVRKRYEELNKENPQLQQVIDDGNKRIADLQKQIQDITNQLQDANNLKKDAQNLKNQTDDEKKQIDDMVANGDPQGFKQYFEQVEPNIASNIYAQIIQNDQNTAELQNFIQMYGSMTPQAAASIFNNLGQDKIDTIINILKNMNQSVASQILAAMDTKLASSITEKMSNIYITK